MAVVIFDSVDNSCIKTLCCCLCLVSLWSPLLRTMLLCLLTPVTLLSWSHSELQWSPGAALLGHTWGATSHHQQPETAPSVRKSQRKNIYLFFINIFIAKFLMIFIISLLDVHLPLPFSDSSGLLYSWVENEILLKAIALTMKMF